MGNALSEKLSETLDRRRLEESSLAPGFRKIFRSWNSTDLWTALRRYWNEYPKRNDYLSYADVQHVLCLDEAEAMFLWDTFHTAGIDMMHRNDMFTSICMYCGSNTAEKGRFLLTLFDTGGRGLVSLNEMHTLVFTVLDILGRPAHVTVKPKAIRALLDAFINFVLDKNNNVYGFEAIAKTICDCKATIVDTDFYEDRILGLIEMQEISRFVSEKIEESFIGAHHSAVENPKRKSPSMIMTRAPTRDFDREALQKQPAADSVSPVQIEEKKEEDTWSDEGRKEEETKIQPVILEEEWCVISLHWAQAKTMKNETVNPQLRTQIRREVCKALACSEHRVIIQCVGQGVIHVAVGGKPMVQVGCDPRSCYQLGHILISQVNQKHSSLKKGLLADVSLYNGVELATKKCIPEDDVVDTGEAAGVAAGGAAGTPEGSPEPIPDDMESDLDQTMQSVMDVRSESEASNIFHLDLRVEL